MGTDGGRHTWYRWMDGPVPESKSMTQAISLFDCTLLSVKSDVGTPEYCWREPKPCSDKVTRVLGTNQTSCVAQFFAIYLQVLSWQKRKTRF